MKRPAFQFYPADWRNNAKLRRCSWAARGVWIELMGLMHDSDHYGVLQWPLKQIAQALGAPIKLLNELVDSGVLYGVEKGESEPFIYRPVSGRVQGEAVELMPAMAGPVWFSPRMVRDEYVRTKRGENSRFGAGDNPSPKPPKGERKGAAPKQSPTYNESDGSTSSSSSSTSVPNGTSAAADARQRFAMSEGWRPDDVSLGSQLRVAGVSREAITADTVAGFVAHYLTLPETHENAAGWCKRLVKWAKREREFNLGNPNAQAKAGSGRHPGGVTLADNLTDTCWADDLELVWQE